jgi:octaprenyl-diphosphate synthase
MELYRNILEKEIKLFENFFSDAVKSKHSMLDSIMKYVVKRKGKQLRPIFVLLSAKLNGIINEKTYRAASLVELLHTATLVHDDVVDESDMRRGFFSINALWKNKIAVLVGDYLLSKGLLLSLDNNDFQILQILSTAVKDMSEGELLQLEKARKLDIKESVYFEIIKGKTASLVAASCAAGCASVNDNINQVNKMKELGEKIGIAFQIKDDLFDYANDNVGKPTGNDIKERKMTLPLIHTLANCTKTEKRMIINIVKNKNTDKSEIKKVLELVHNYDGINYTIQKMNEIKSEALQILYSFPTSSERDAFEELINFTTDRKY